MLKPSLLNRANEGSRRFFASADSRVVYFSEDGEVIFTTDGVRVRAWLKERE